MNAVFALRMAGAFLLAYAAWATAPAGMQRFFLERLTVAPAAALVNLVSPAESAAAQGPALVSPRARLSVREGCDGLDAMLLLAAALIAAPRGWRARRIGLAGGLLLLYALNQARIVALWFALRHDREVFTLLHGIVAPAVLAGAACAFFAWWLWRRPPAPA